MSSASATWRAWKAFLSAASHASNAARRAFAAGLPSGRCRCGPVWGAVRVWWAAWRAARARTREARATATWSAAWKALVESAERGAFTQLNANKVRPLDAASLAAQAWARACDADCDAAEALRAGRRWELKWIQAAARAYVGEYLAWKTVETVWKAAEKAWEKGR